MKESKKNLVQIRNPKSGDYVKIDKSKGKIISRKKTPYKGILIINKSEEDS